MFNRLTVLAAAIAFLMASAAPASASYLITKGQARDFANSEISTRYQTLGVPDAGGAQSCRPQKSRSNAYKGAKAHRWVCSWKADTFAGTSCVGKVLIVGSADDVDDTYYRMVLQPARCTN